MYWVCVSFFLGDSNNIFFHAYPRTLPPTPWSQTSASYGSYIHAPSARKMGGQSRSAVFGK